MHVDLRNHAPLRLRIDSFRYLARIDGKRMGTQGAKDQPAAVQRRGSSQQEIPVSVDTSQLKRKIKDMQQDCVDVEMTM